MEKVCVNCSAKFEVTDEDLEFFNKLDASAIELKGISPQSICPDCRQQRRLVRRNERVLYRRDCDACKTQVLAMSPADAPFPVYCSNCWWSDNWDPLSYGKEIDFNRPFMEQFAELQNAVPRAALFGKNNENSDYSNHIENNKNIYLCADVAMSQDIFYSRWIIKCKDLCDCYQLEECELCYESQYSVGMQNNIYTEWSDQSTNLAFCTDCKGCSDCMFCSHLRHKKFCMFNKQLTEEEYREKCAQYDLGSYSIFQDALGKYHEIRSQMFHMAHHFINAEDCTGDYMYNCKNVKSSFGVIESQDCAYCYDAGHMKDCQDAYEPAFECELQYDCHACNRGKRILSNSICYDIDSSAYCDTCHNSSNLFGCIALRHKQYCILNKQYSKEEYEEIVPKLIAHMQSSGEWGEFFPIRLSPFCYNETVAQWYYPLSKEEVLAKGFKWKDREDDVSNVTKKIPAAKLPDHIKEIPDDVLNWAIECNVTGRPFKIAKQELEFYRKMNLPIPRTHPDERQDRRLAYTNPRKLFERACDKCNKTVKTSFSVERPETIYCEECYRKEVY